MPYNQTIYSVTRDTPSGSDDYIEYYQVEKASLCDNARRVMQFAENFAIFGVGEPIGANIVPWSNQVEIYGSCVDNPEGCKVARVLTNEGKLFLICGDAGRVAQWASGQGVTLLSYTMLKGIFRSVFNCNKE